MGDFVKTGVDAYSTAGAAKDIDATWTYGSWVEGHPYQGLVVFSLTLSGTAPTKMEAKVQLGVGDDYTTPTSRGFVPQINSVSGGETDWDPSVQTLPLDAGPNVFEIPIRPNYHWRLALKRTGGDATTKGLAVADVIR